MLVIEVAEVAQEEEVVGVCRSIAVVEVEVDAVSKTASKKYWW